MLLLPVLALTVKWHSLELAVAISAAVVVLVLRPKIIRIIDSGTELPTTATISEGQALHAFNKLVAQTIASSALSLGVLTVTPFLVTVFAGPKQGALFALSLAVVQILDMVAVALGLSLVVHASSAPEHGNTMARGILISAAALIVAGAAIIVAVVPVAFRLLNPQYGEMGATGVVAVLCLGSIIRVVYIVWSGLQRSRRKMKMLLTLNVITGPMIVALIPGLCGEYGALGGAVAVLIAQMVLSAGAVIHFLSTRRSGRDIATWVATAESRKTK
jgi:O-antigen/teichoic acid export membrane protein